MRDERGRVFRRAKGGRPGFTLFEVVLVLLILGIAAEMVVHRNRIPVAIDHPFYIMSELGIVAHCGIQHRQRRVAPGRGVRVMLDVIGVHPRDEGISRVVLDVEDSERIGGTRAEEWRAVRGLRRDPRRPLVGESPHALGVTLALDGVADRADE